MYLEKRRQPLWLLALSLLMTSTFGVAVSAASSQVIGYGIGLASSCAVIAVWWRLRGNIELDDQSLRVGRWVLPREFIGQVEALSATDFLKRTREQVRADDALSLLAREHGGLVIENLDPADPYRHWVIGSARAEVLANLLRSD